MSSNTTQGVRVLHVIVQSNVPHRGGSRKCHGKSTHDGDRNQASVGSRREGVAYGATETIGQFVVFG